MARREREALLKQAHEQKLTNEQIIPILSQLIDTNEHYLEQRRRRGYATPLDSLLRQAQPALALAIEQLQTLIPPLSNPEQDHSVKHVS